MFVRPDEAREERRIHLAGFAVPLRNPTVMALASLFTAMSRVTTMNGKRT